MHKLREDMRVNVATKKKPSIKRFRFAKGHGGGEVTEQEVVGHVFKRPSAPGVPVLVSATNGIGGARRAS